MIKNALKFCGFLVICLSISESSWSANIEKNTARMQAMDKITGRVSMINVPVNGEIKFGSLSVIVRNCQSRPEEEAPDHFAFVDITDTTHDGDIENIFKGWMIASSPATNALEHPIYDVWLLKCLNTKNNKTKLLTEEQLAQRDTLPMRRLQPLRSPEDTEQEAEPSQLTEMSAEPQKEKNQPEILLPEEFTFDEDEETLSSYSSQEIIPTQDENPVTEDTTTKTE